MCLAVGGLPYGSGEPDPTPPLSEECLHSRGSFHVAETTLAEASGGGASFVSDWDKSRWAPGPTHSQGAYPSEDGSKSLSLLRSGAFRSRALGFPFETNNIRRAGPPKRYQCKRIELPLLTSQYCRGISKQATSASLLYLTLHAQRLCTIVNTGETCCGPMNTAPFRFRAGFWLPKSCANSSIAPSVWRGGNLVA